MCRDVKKAFSSALTSGNSHYLRRKQDLEEFAVYRRQDFGEREESSYSRSDIARGMHNGGDWNSSLPSLIVLLVRNFLTVKLLLQYPRLATVSMFMTLASDAHTKRLFLPPMHAARSLENRPS